MNTELKNAVNATDKTAQYDASAKRLLAQKSILAHILVKTVDEFRGMKPEDVVAYIEGTPYVMTVPTEPGLTNCVYEKNGERLVGLNTENQELQEGMVRFDIVFYVNIPLTSEENREYRLSQMIINIEAQRKETSEYKILNRAVFYGSRLISSQKERDFTNSNYDDIKRVYSIWVCMNMKENSMSYIHLTEKDLIGSGGWKGDLKLLNIIMIGLGKELPKHDEIYELHRLLGALLSEKLTVDEKLDIMETEYGTTIEEALREEVKGMSNLGEGIMEEGIAIGVEKEKTRIIFQMDKKGFSVEQIAEVTGKTKEEVETVLSGKELTLV